MDDNIHKDDAMSAPPPSGTPRFSSAPSDDAGKASPDDTKKAPSDDTKKASASASDSKADTASSESASSQSASKAKRSKKSVEDRLDDLADRFSKVMSDGVKRMETAFDESMERIRQDPDFSKGGAKTFFTSTSGSLLVIVIAIIWFFYAVGLLDNWFMPLILLAGGIYLFRKGRSGD